MLAVHGAITPPSAQPKLHSVGAGCGWYLRGGIGIAQQGIHPGVETGEPLVLLPELLGFFLDLLGFAPDLLGFDLQLLQTLLAFELAQLVLLHLLLNVGEWMPIQSPFRR